MKQIVKTLTGSRAHGLHNDNSDYDWRGVFAVELIDHVSPFRKFKNNHWIEGDEDNTSYELSHFVKGCCQCNPNFLEVLYAPVEGEFDPVWEVLSKSHTRFLDSERLLASHLGYAKNQETKMGLHKPTERTAKYAVAYIRSLHNGIQLLNDQFLDLYIDDEKLREDLWGIKYNFEEYKPRAIELFAEKNKEIHEAYEKNPNMRPDIKYFENVLLDYYSNKL